MKRLLLPLFALLAALTCAHGGTVELWSGKWCELPGSGKWQLVAKHGRVLASGNGSIRFQLPPLKAGTTLNADLKTANGVKKLRFHSPAPLSGITATEFELPAAQLKLLKNYGVNFTEKSNTNIVFSSSIQKLPPGKLQLLFTQKADFPITFEKTWKTICDCDVSAPGSLGINFTKQEKIIDNNGEYNYITLEKDQRKLVIFPPGFDLNNIENVILLKYIIETNIHIKGAEK
jgi:hypothetical protein